MIFLGKSYWPLNLELGPLRASIWPVCKESRSSFVVFGLSTIGPGYFGKCADSSLYPVFAHTRVKLGFPDTSF